MWSDESVSVGADLNNPDDWFVINTFRIALDGVQRTAAVDSCAAAGCAQQCPLAYVPPIYNVCTRAQVYGDFNSERCAGNSLKLQKSVLTRVTSCRFRRARGKLKNPAVFGQTGDSLVLASTWGPRFFWI